MPEQIYLERKTGKTTERYLEGVKEGRKLWGWFDKYQIDKWKLHKMKCQVDEVIWFDDRVIILLKFQRQL